jgi:hypothetical protein
MQRGLEQGRPPFSLLSNRHFDLNGTIEGVELAGASDFLQGFVVIASGALPGGS